MGKGTSYVAKQPDANGFIVHGRRKRNLGHSD